MRFLVIILILTMAVTFSLGQTDETPTPTPEPTDREVLDKARAIKTVKRRVTALESFIDKFPDSDLRPEASEFLVSSRAAVADELLRNGNTKEGIELFRKAVEETPRPIPGSLFQKVLVNIPTNLYLLGQPKEAIDIADKLEEMSGDNVPRLLRVAAFHLAIKYATGARRIAERSIVLDPASAPAHKLRADAARLGFDLQAAAESYARALELEPTKDALKRNLAEMKRALGMSDEALLLYREIVENNAEDVAARTGVILSLFELGQRKEAEEQLVAELSSNVTNGFAMIGAANWYVANDEPDLAIDYAKQAITLEQSAVWAYITLGRAYMLKKEPAEAERYLVAARRISSLPTLSFELALAHFGAGSFRSALTELQTNFLLENGKLVTSLDGRVGVEAESFEKAVVLERKSFLFSSAGAYSSSVTEKLMALFRLDLAVKTAGTEPEELARLVREFVEGEKSMRGFRKLFAAELLLQNGKSPELAQQLAESAINDTDTAVWSDSAASATLSDALYPQRMEAARSGNVILVPDVEKKTLERILRGKIEAIAAVALISKGEYVDAELKLRRAVSILPKDSTWWRSSKWLLGQVYESTGEDKKALENYAESYRAGQIGNASRAKLEEIYTKINGSSEGLNDYLSTRTAADTSAASLFLKNGNSPTTKPKESAVDNEKAIIPADVPGIPAPANPAKEDTKESKEKNDGEVETRLPEDLILDLGKRVEVKTVTPKPTPLPTKSESVKEGKETPPPDDEAQKTIPADVPEVPVVVIDTTASNSQSDVKSPAKENETPATPTSKPENTVEPGDSKESKTAIKTDSELEEGKLKSDSEVVVKAPKSDGKESSGDKDILTKTGAQRARIVAPDKVRVVENEDKSPKCELIFSQQRVSIFSNGGSFGIVVGIDNYPEAYMLRARSLSPKDVNVKHEPAIGSIDGRAFFVLTSVSSEKGTFKVEFDSPCGKKIAEVVVY